MSEYYFTKNNVEELMKCKDDFKYFAVNYLKVSTPDGIAPFRWNDGFDKAIEELEKKKRHENLNLWRQTGKTTFGLAVKLHMSIFTNYKTLVSYWHNTPMARDAEFKFLEMRSNLPEFIKAVDTSIISRSLSSRMGPENQLLFTSSGNSRGFNIDFLYIDEVNYMTPFTKDHLHSNYMASVVSKGKYLSLST